MIRLKQDRPAFCRAISLHLCDRKTFPAHLCGPSPIGYISGGENMRQVVFLFTESEFQVTGSCDELFSVHISVKNLSAARTLFCIRHFVPPCLHILAVINVYFLCVFCINDILSPFPRLFQCRSRISVFISLSTTFCFVINVFVGIVRESVADFALYFSWIASRDVQESASVFVRKSQEWPFSDFRCCKVFHPAS